MKQMATATYRILLPVPEDKKKRPPVPKQSLQYVGKHIVPDMQKIVNINKEDCGNGQDRAGHQ